MFDKILIILLGPQLPTASAGEAGASFDRMKFPLVREKFGEIVANTKDEAITIIDGAKEFFRFRRSGLNLCKYSKIILEDRPAFQSPETLMSEVWLNIKEFLAKNPKIDFYHEVSAPL